MTTAEHGCLSINVTSSGYVHLLGIDPPSEIFVVPVTVCDNTVWYIVLWGVLVQYITALYHCTVQGEFPQWNIKDSTKFIKQSLINLHLVKTIGVLV